jgi:hypothetical protein
VKTINTDSMIDACRCRGDREAMWRTADPQTGVQISFPAPDYHT